LTADHLTNGVQKAIHAQAIEARHAQVHAFADELAAMDADLAKIRAESVPPVVTCQTVEEMHELNNKEIGTDFCEKPYLY
jgi:hypothetical protein